eukprot:8451275-Pyramimonas_sp.AAC.1
MATRFRRFPRLLRLSNLSRQWRDAARRAIRRESSGRKGIFSTATTRSHCLGKSGELSNSGPGRTDPRRTQSRSRSP